MSLENIIKKIIDEAEESAADILKSAREKAEEIEKNSRQEADRRAGEMMLKAEREGKLEAGQIITQARLKRRLVLLECRRELIDSVLQEAFRAKPEYHENVKRTIISKEGEIEEKVDDMRLIDELRPQLEAYIAGILKI